MSKVYCGNLEWSVTEDDIEKHMSKVGKIVFSTITREQSGYSRGWGIVEYETAEDAEKAVNELNNSVLKGRNMLCKIIILRHRDRYFYCFCFLNSSDFSFSPVCKAVCSSKPFCSA